MRATSACTQLLSEPTLQVLIKKFPYEWDDLTFRKWAEGWLQHFVLAPLLKPGDT